MAVKQFDNFDYDFAKKQKAETEKRLKIAAGTFAVVILIFMCWSLINSFNLFSTSTTSVNQPIRDNVDEEQRLREANQALINRYAAAKIPYTDPQNRFQINFLTPFVSDKVVVIINTPQNRDQIVQEANTIINTAKQSVQITSVSYVENY